MRRSVVLGALIAIGALTVGLAGQQQRAPLPDLQKVKDNLYIIGASSPVDRSQFTGGNVGVFVTDAGVIVVDTKLAGYGPDILARIKAVTSKPVTTIINTHTHGDHTGSNEGFPTSVNIVAHENTKTLMAKMDAFKGEKAQFLPKQTYKDKLTLGSGKDRVELYYFGKGHTGGDTMVYYPTLRVLQTGDLWAWKDAPLIDLANDGSGVELPKTLAKAIATLKDMETVIPGHTPISKPAELQEYQRYMADLVAETEAAIKGGKSAADAAAASTVTAKYAGYKSDRLKAAIEALYKEMGK
ncbi:MAG TPA: MBL fold metallo-hydrolase [Vicinamibacterales bacterium]|nr:MBL fold metallo-hydrolase [Vicinamibacterales bacterium]